MFSKLLKLDWILLVAVLLLLSIGLLSLYSLSTSGPTAANQNIFTKQLIFVFLGLGVMFFFAFLDYHYLRSYSTFFYFISLISLIFVLLWGGTIRETVGWLGFGAFHVQPVEIAKIGLIVFLASLISQKRMEFGEAGRMITSFIMASLMIYLVLRQPDFGSAVILAIIWLGMIVISGMSRKTLLILLILVILASFSSWFFLAPYQKDRLVNIVRPEFDPQGSSYNVSQSLIAVGSGGFSGMGIGRGTQSQLNFLPEKHNDFIFAMIAEELGLLGSFLVLFLFFIILYRLKKIADRAPDNFGFLLASGIMIVFFFQIFINAGMNLGIVPVAGISLPLVSYGGSFLFTALILIGVALNIGSKYSTLARSGKTDYTD